MSHQSKVRSDKEGVDRRGFIAGTVALSAATVSSPSHAQTTAAIVAEEHWEQKGESKLYMYRKRQVPAAGPQLVVVLVHGSTFSGRGGFDLQVPNHPDYSLMDFFAGRGFDVWTLDHEGYGQSTRPQKFIGIQTGADDLKIGFSKIEKVTGVKAPMVYAQSSGALRAALFASQNPERVERIVLDAFTFHGKEAPEIQRRRARAEEFKTNPVRKLTKENFHSIFSRDDPSTYTPAVADALAAFELKFGNTAPSGIYYDMALNLPLNQPEALKCPVCMTRADHDGNSTEEELYEYFARLPNRDKQFHMMLGVAHVAVLGINRHRIWHVLHEFFTYPALRTA